ncbi:MAG: hypothetical protein AAGA29_08135 [Planctomycetota bacterium]
MMHLHWALLRKCLLGQALLLVLFVFAAPPAHAQAGGDGELDRAGQRVFRNYTRIFCRQFFVYEDTYVMLPNHYREREASTGRTYDEAEAELTETRTEQVSGSIVRTVKIPPPRGEVIALSMVIPEIEVGHYGFIDSVTVARVVRDNEMIVRSLRLIDPAAVGTERNTHRLALAERQKEYEELTFRLHGFSTEGLSPGDRYRGPDDKGINVAVAGVDQHHNFVLVSFDRLRRIRTNQFADALAHVGLTPAAFNEMVRANRETHGAQGDRATLFSLYREYYTAFRVPRPEPEARPDPGRVPEQPPAPREPDLPADTPDEPDTPDTDPDVPNEPLFPDLEDEPVIPDLPEALPPADRDEDDWDDDWTPEPPSDEPGFFGVPLE